MKRLNIVVPYRAREAHLRQFVPHVRSYFARDKVDRDIPYRVLIVEQEHDGLPFNRGALKNVGFVLGRDGSDYTAFHDIDYLPVWADYTFPDTLTPIVWYGAEARPLVVGRAGVIVNPLERFFGAVALTPNEMFEQVDGFANSYWGWGYEDMDLAQRFLKAGFSHGRRKGTFLALDHQNEGLQIDKKTGAKIEQTPISVVNERLYQAKWSEGGTPSKNDGLSSLDFTILQRRAVPEISSSERQGSWEIVTVRLNMRPTPEQVTADILTRNA